MVKHGNTLMTFTVTKAEEARNVRVVLARDGFNPYRKSDALYTCWPVFVIPVNLPPVYAFKDRTYSCR
jgi:hypothetical protein